MNPPGGETPVAELLATTLRNRGIDAEVLEAAPGRGNVIARVPATDPDGRGALLLLAHLDVVPADPDAWSLPPFSGAVRDGFVHGRGALDDKGHAVVLLEALALLAERTGQRGRDVVFAGTAGEEVDGMGVQWLIANHWKALGPPVAVWNEGGASAPLAEAGGRLVHGIATGEKRALWLSLVAEGEGGHGSTPIEGSAPGRLVRALARIEAWETPIRISPEVGESMRRVAERLPGLEGFVLGRLGNPIVQALIGDRLIASRTINAMVRDTVSLTGLEAGIKHNVIPPRAEARIDVRLLPDTDAAEFVRELTRVIDDPEVRVVLPESGLPPMIPASPSDHEVFRAIEAEMQRESPDGIAVPMQANGATDSSFFRARGVPAYGYMPIELGNELGATMHGAGERVPVVELERAVRVTLRTLVRLTRPE